MQHKERIADVNENAGGFTLIRLDARTGRRAT